MVLAVLQPAISASSSSVPRRDFRLRKHPVFFLYKKRATEPMRATPAMGAAMAMTVTRTLDPPLLSMLLLLLPLLAAFSSAGVPGVVAWEDGAADNVEVSSVVDTGSAIAVEDGTALVGVTAGGSSAVPVEEMRDETDSSRDVADDGKAGVVAGAVVVVGSGGGGWTGEEGGVGLGCDGADDEDWLSEEADVGADGGETVEVGTG